MSKFITVKRVAIAVFRWLRDAHQWVFRYERRVSEYSALILERGAGLSPGPMRVSWEVRMPNGTTKTKHVSSRFGHVWARPDGSRVGHPGAATFIRLVGANKPKSAEEIATRRLKEIQEHNAMMAELDKAEEGSSK